MIKKIKTVFKNLMYSAPLSAIINFIWHVTSLTPCTNIERIAGWSLVWLAVAVIIWSYSNLKEKAKIMFFREPILVPVCLPKD